MLNIIVIDEKDKIIGFKDKMTVHKTGLLHRAFSVFIMNSKNELLIQQRALNKYHSAGLWSNTCCSHFVSEKNEGEQAEKRLKEEMGIASRLRWIFNYRYTVKLDNDLIENEIVYAYLGFSDEVPHPDKEEVHEWKYIQIRVLLKDMKKQPDTYTYWFKFAMREFAEKFKNFNIV